MELGRLAIGFIAAVAVPASIPRLRAQAYWTVLFAFAYAAYTSFAILDGIRAWAIGLFAAVLALIICKRRSRSDVSANVVNGDVEVAVPRLGIGKKYGLFEGTVKFYRYLVCRIDVLVLLVILCIAGVIAFGLYERGGLTRLIENDRIALLSSGALLAVFAGNELVLVVIRPYLLSLERQGENVASIVPTGLHIGWIERTIVFSFIVAGEPEAATLAVAAKSLIRIPEVQRHAGVFAQYVVVGTLANLLVAMLAAIMVRVSCGLSPL
ncbi:hypothetical protein AB0J90_20645 [Micromonospora sp. NPDC049523]|uniref:hypothetical protein n=1 Tax=Micromonospora sp. NPDC049523 TaxID=3155921 RepID=UPI00343C7DC0